jgi:hypothetical protein
LDCGTPGEILPRFRRLLSSNAPCEIRRR